jgi:glutamate dehydrogenase/leucine dehydrogenase
MSIIAAGSVQSATGTADRHGVSLDPASDPADFAASLRGDLGGRAWLVRDPDGPGYLPSSPRLAGLADLLGRDRRDVDGHEAVFLEVGRGSGALFAAVLHSSARGQAQGGVRRAPYASVEALLRDGLRLARAMTRKNALARLWWGGGKGIIAAPAAGDDAAPDLRRLLYQEYGAFVTGLRGCYVAAEDAGTGPADLAEMARATRFATCLPPERGGSGSPAGMTAAGVVSAMEAALAFVGRPGLAGRRVVLQGAGQVGSALLRLLLERRAGAVVVGETCAERCEALRDAFPEEAVEIRHVSAGDPRLLGEPCDVLSPCALGGVLGRKTIEGLRAGIVCGAANDPLEDEAPDAAALAARGVVYVPDFVANRMGIVCCANEQYGALARDPDILRHLDPGWRGSIPRTTRLVLEEARERGTTPLDEALRLAARLARELHPLWPRRGQAIVESLVRGGWAGGA